MSFNKFAAGRKVYGQGATSPTRGTLNPSGYVKRELARRSTQHGVSRVGGDGQSDTRSGLAAKSIRDYGGPKDGRPQVGNLNPGKNKNRFNNPLAGNRGQSNQQQGQGQKGQPAGQVTTQAPATPVTPAIQVNNNGILELPYNSDFYNQALDAQQSFDNEIMNLNYEDQGQDQEYASFMRELEQGYGDRQLDTLNNNAGNGTLFSSAYTTGVNNDAREYTNTKNDAVARDSIFNNSIANRRNAATAYLNQMLQRATQGYADSLAEGAGGLGFGTDGPAPADAVPVVPAPAPVGNPLQTGLKPGKSNNGAGKRANGPQWGNQWGNNPPKGGGGGNKKNDPPKNNNKNNGKKGKR